MHRFQAMGAPIARGRRRDAAPAASGRQVGEAPFYRLVYRLVRRVPRGKVVTYGQVAAILGQPRGARALGMALGALRGPLVDVVPWQRVINAAGRPSRRDGFWAAIRREMLEKRASASIGAAGSTSCAPAGWGRGANG